MNLRAERVSVLWWVDIHGRAIKRYDGESLRVLPMPARAAGQHRLAPRRRDAGRAARRRVPARHRAAEAPRQACRSRRGPALQRRALRPRRALLGRHSQGSELRSRGSSLPGGERWFLPVVQDRDPGAEQPRLEPRPAHDVFRRQPAPQDPGVDAKGCLWNAEWGAARVVRYTPAGKIDRWIEVPAKNPTCCCFGGSNLDTLYITSADRAGLFALAPGVKGLAESRFG